MTRFFFFFFFGGGGGGGEIRFLTGVGVNLYAWTGDSKKIEMYIEIKDLGRDKRIIVIVKFQYEC